MPPTLSRARLVAGRLVLGLSVLATFAKPVHAETEPTLFKETLRLEPSVPRVRTLPRFEARWVVPATDTPSLATRLTAAGLSCAAVDAIARRAHIEPSTAQAQIVPDRELLDTLGESDRSALFDLLASCPANEYHGWPVVVDAATLDELEGQPGTAEAARRVRRWSVHRGTLHVFADLFALEDAFPASANRRAFYQAALGADTLFVKLEPRIENPTDAANEAAYWQVHGRYRAIEPFLNAVAGVPDKDRIDIAHILPRLPRALLYTYPPDLGRAEMPNVESGLMASEFFSHENGVETGAADGLSGWLGRECDSVASGSPRQYGDILVFEDPSRTPWPYAAVYIADGVVFGRAPTAFGPWTFMSAKSLSQVNPRLVREGPRTYRPRASLATSTGAPFVHARMSDAWRDDLVLHPASRGPWGRLWYYPVLLAPSSDALRALPPPAKQETWTFRDLPADTLDRALQSDSLTPETASRLRELFRNARADTSGSISVQPPLELVLAAPREFRAQVFPYLVGGTGASDAVQHIGFPTVDHVDRWFDSGSLPTSVRDLILRLSYPMPDGTCRLSDYGALYHALETPEERMTAQRTALRSSAVVVLLEKPGSDEVDAIADYWALDQGKNVQRLLRSFAASESARYLDIVHLLPPVAREFVNTYFLSDEPVLTPSCFWTTFNFGADRPDARYLVTPGEWTEHRAQAWNELMTRFEMIDGPSQLGDIIVYRHAGRDEAEHVCSYVADDIAYTKNGFTFSAPWCLSPIADLDATYLKGDDMERVCFRRR